MPPPSLLISTIVRSSPSAGRRAARRCRGQRDVADQQDGRPRGRRGDAERRRDGPVDAVGAAVGQDPRRRVARRREKVSRSRTGIEEATTSVSRSSSAAERARGDRRLGELAPAERRPSTSITVVVGARASASSHSGAAIGSGGSVAGSRSQRRRSTTAHGVLPRAVRVQRDLRARRGRRATGAAAWRSGGRRRGHEVRRVRGGPRLVAQEHVVVGDRGRRGGRRTAGRRAAGCRVVALHGARPRPGARGARRRGPAARRARARRAGGRGAAGVGRGRATVHGPPVRRARSRRRAAARRAPAARAARSSGAPGPGRPDVRRPDGAAGQLAQPAQALRRGRRVVDLEVPLGARP